MDIVGDRITEITVQSPGGIQSAERFEGLACSSEIIRALERKVEYRSQNSQGVSNSELATL
jgi:glutathione synthase